MSNETRSTIAFLSVTLGLTIVVWGPMEPWQLIVAFASQLGALTTLLWPRGRKR